jgi:hypothetical protein
LQVKNFIIEFKNKFKKALLFISVFFLTFLLVSCSEPCKSDEAKEYLKEFKSINQEFIDKVELFSVKKDMKFSDKISEFQDTRKSLVALTLPLGCEKFADLYKLSKSAMDDCIGVYLGIQENSENETIIDTIKLKEIKDIEIKTITAVSDINKAVNELEEYQNKEPAWWQKILKRD